MKDLKIKKLIKNNFKKQFKKLIILNIIISLIFLRISNNKNIFTDKNFSVIKNLIPNYYNSIKLNLKEERNNTFILIEKLNFLKLLSNNLGKNITSIKSIILESKARFGNQFLLLNKAIFYCEILRCKRIILNKEYYWFIKNQIFDKNKMIIKIKNKIFFQNAGSIIDKSYIFYYYINYFKPDLKVKLLNKEVLKNIPKIIINNNDLYIYIRSGDIFKTKKPHNNYSQPPLCFYHKIIKNYKFKNINIISENKNNPNINKLLNEFPNIIYNYNSLKIDISYLIYAYNLVEAPSTFFFCIFNLNKNIKFLWEFDFNKYIKHNFLNIYINTFNKPKKNFIIYRMKSSTNYINKMKSWKNSASQINLMITSDCPYNFSIILNN